MAAFRQTIAVDEGGDSAEAGAVSRWIAGWLSTERERLILWLPVGLGAGVGIYFALPTEPGPWAALVVIFGAGLLFASTWRLRTLPGRMLVGVALAVLLAGFGLLVATLRTASIDTLLLARETRPLEIHGTVRSVEPRASGNRVVIDIGPLPETSADRSPRRIRINVRTKGDPVAPGDRISVRAVLMPLPDPVLPGGFDFARQLFFRGIGATGYAVGPVLVEEGGQAERSGWRTMVERVRHRIADRISAALEGVDNDRRGTAAMARALLTGQKGGIPKPVIEAMRKAGLAHLLAISGLHIGLVAAILFFVLRAGLAAIEPAALHWPVKKIAAVGALGCAFLYLLITGMTVPTQRAFLMISVVIVALLIDRAAISMRLVAWAAVVILLLRPESLISVSFQLSFAAVVGLVAAYEIWRRPGPARRRGGGFWRVPAAYVLGVAMTSVVATLATAPFAAYHFNRVAVYGLIANMIAVPVTAIWIMPAGIAALLLMPFGLEALALAPMGWGIDLIVRVATTVSGWPGSVLHIAQMPLASLIAITLGGLWLCFWSGRGRWLGLGVIGVGIALAPIVRGPDILVTGDGKLFAVRDDHGNLAVSSRRAARFSRGRWLAANGQTEPAPWADDESHAWAEGGLRCDLQGCLYRSGGRIAALVQRPDALAEDCALADIVISTVPAWTLCTGPEIVIDRFDLWRDGTHAIWLNDTGIEVRAVRPRRGARPWVIQPAARARPSPAPNSAGSSPPTAPES